MKVFKIQKFIFIGLIIFVCSCLCKVTAQNQSTAPQDFIILNTKDTVYGEKIRLIQWFQRLGRLTVFKKNDEKLVYGFNEVYQIHEFNRKGKVTVHEFVKEAFYDENSYTTMEIVYNTGKVKLYYNEQGEGPDRPFIVSDFYHGVVYRRGHKKLLAEFDKCVAFREQFSTKKLRRRKHIEKFVAFYNEFCGD